MQQMILYIEDNPDNMQIVEKALKAKGYFIIGAKNGLDGLEVAKANPPDLILLDINLPDIDGYEVARRLRSLGKPISSIPILAITAHALKGDAEKVLAAGCDAYMVKPINIRELWARVDFFLTK